MLFNFSFAFQLKRWVLTADRNPSPRHKGLVILLFVCFLFLPPPHPPPPTNWRSWSIWNNKNTNLEIWPPQEASLACSPPQSWLPLWSWLRLLLWSWRSLWMRRPWRAPWVWPTLWSCLFHQSCWSWPRGPPRAGALYVTETTQGGKGGEWSFVAQHPWRPEGLLGTGTEEWNLETGANLED